MKNYEREREQRERERETRGFPVRASRGTGSDIAPVRILTPSRSNFREEIRGCVAVRKVISKRRGEESFREKLPGEVRDYEMHYTLRAALLLLLVYVRESWLSLPLSLSLSVFSSARYTLTYVGHDLAAESIAANAIANTIPSGLLHARARGIYLLRSVSFVTSSGNAVDVGRKIDRGRRSRIETRIRFAIDPL